ncbi:hypothetical protein GGP41_004936 [Bipolaris sorokiniana]|uniref:Uncharacterized protein n=1 Tax=Cochliobolus sativus TaxID=45130 RepID=A0A8H5Z7J3_COCSA|nr:hypothetical protein GGP41_004936 [Bipolaris sorokiniana]
MARHSLFKFWAASLATLSLFTPTDCTKLWPNAGALPGIIPAPCRAALTANITCSDFITAREIVNDVPINSQFLKTYCTTDCRRSLQTWATNVNTRCGNTIYNFTNATKQSGNDIAQPMLWAQNVACLAEP